MFWLIVLLSIGAIGAGVLLYILYQMSLLWVKVEEEKAESPLEVIAVESIDENTRCNSMTDFKITSCDQVDEPEQD